MRQTLATFPCIELSASMETPEFSNDLVYSMILRGSIGSGNFKESLIPFSHIKINIVLVMIELNVVRPT